MSGGSLTGMACSESLQSAPEVEPVADALPICQEPKTERQRSFQPEQSSQRQKITKLIKLRHLCPAWYKELNAKSARALVSRSVDELDRLLQQAEADPETLENARSDFVMPDVEASLPLARLRSFDVLLKEASLHVPFNVDIFRPAAVGKKRGTWKRKRSS
eukprot:1103757-Amphidinium_carterae.1